MTIHYAQTLDGRIADRDGNSRWISGQPALRYAHELRAAHDAVLIGVGTVLRDNPRLTVRLAEGLDPLKVVLDSRLRTPSTAALLVERPERALFLTTPAAPSAGVERLERLGARVLITGPSPAGQVDLEEGLERVAALGVRSLLAEGGARVVTSLLRQRLGDRLVVCLAPMLLGTGVASIGDLGIDGLAQALGLGDLQLSRLGDDLLISGNLSS